MKCNENCARCRRTFCIDVQSEQEFWEWVKENEEFGYRQVIEEQYDELPDEEIDDDFYFNGEN